MLLKSGVMKKITSLQKIAEQNTIWLSSECLPAAHFCCKRMPAKSFEPESVLLCLVSQLWRPGRAVNFLFVFHLFRQGCTTIFITNIQTWSSHNPCWFIIFHSIYYFIILKKCFHYHFCFQRTKILSSPLKIRINKNVFFSNHEIMMHLLHSIDLAKIGN